MARDKLQVYYLLSLLVLAILLIMFVQNMFSGLSTTSVEPMVEISRMDMFDTFLGNYSKISVVLTNNDTNSHYFSINTFYDEIPKGTFNVTVNGGTTFKYERDVLPDRIPISEYETINSTLQVAKFVVYMDNQPEPFEKARFVFKNK